MHCLSRCEKNWNNRELTVEFIFATFRKQLRSQRNSEFIFGTFPKQLRSQSSFSDLGGTWSSDNRNSAKLRV